MFRKLAPALFISVTIHFLLIWYLVDKLQDYLQHSPNTTPPSPIQITLDLPTISRVTHADAESSAVVTNKPTPIPETPPSPPPSIKQHKLSNKPTQGSSIKPPEQKVTSGRILTSSKEISREMASIDQPEHTTPAKDSISTIFNRALDDNREAAGVSTLADGTTRVVTEFGNSYCIKALDDWMIVDPQDDMRVLFFCK
ncbi:MAG: hypothetical protein P8163_16530 [Candidatus Thiodiazotropha sp.]